MHVATEWGTSKRRIKVLHCSSTCFAHWYALPTGQIWSRNDVQDWHLTTGRDPARLQHCVAHANRAFPNDSAVAPLAKVSRVLGSALRWRCFFDVDCHGCVFLTHVQRSHCHTFSMRCDRPCIPPVFRFRPTSSPSTCLMPCLASWPTASGWRSRNGFAGHECASVSKRLSQFVHRH